MKLTVKIYSFLKVLRENTCLLKDEHLIDSNFNLLLQLSGISRSKVAYVKEKTDTAKQWYIVSRLDLLSLHNIVFLYLYNIQFTIINWKNIILPWINESSLRITYILWPLHFRQVARIQNLTDGRRFLVRGLFSSSLWNKSSLGNAGYYQINTVFSKTL